MPRTKRPRIGRKQEKQSVDENVLKGLYQYADEQKKAIDVAIESQLENLEFLFNILLTKNKELLQKTVGQVLLEPHIPEATTRTRRSRSMCRSVSKDDGYQTENSSCGSGGAAAKKMDPPLSSCPRTNSRRSRSADASARSIRTVSRSRNTSQASSRQAYKTPALNRNATNLYPVITPKVAPHTPLTVLRQPRMGEMVLSMSGSPVMVPSVCTMQQSEKANCNIMLQDGTMLSLQPKALRQSQAYIPFSLMDANVLDQLKTLKDNLAKVVKLGEKAIK